MNEDSAASVPASAPATPSAPSFEGGVASSDDIAAVWSSLEADAGADSSPAQPEPSVPPAAAPTTPSEGSVVSSTPSSTEDTGPIPFERHKQILENARREAEAKARTELSQRLGWAEKYQPDVVEQGARLHAWLNQNPIEFRAWLDQQIAQRGIAPQQDEGPPPPDLRAEDGTAVYSAEQMQKLIAHERKQMLAEIRKDYDPVRQVVTKQELDQRSRQQAVSIVAEARTNWPMFSKLEPEIKARMASGLDLQAAYFAAFRERGMPSFEQEVRSQYEGALKDKGNATTTRPGAQADTPVSFKDMDTLEITKHFFKQAEAAGRR